jgi:hypothetical protein
MNRLRMVYWIAIWGLSMSLGIEDSVSGQDWKFEQIGTGVIISVIEVDHNGFPHIVYYDLDKRDEVKYTFWDGSSWQTQLISRSGYWYGRVDIGLDTKGNAHIVYSESPKNQPARFRQESLWYSVWEGKTRKNLQEIDKTYDIFEVTIALDSRDYPHICYRYITLSGTTFTDSSLRYAAWNGINWEKETIAAFAVTNRGEKFPSIAVDKDDIPHVTFYDEPTEVLRYAKRSDRLKSDKTHWWEDESVDFSSDGPTHLCIDSNGFPHVSYNNPKEKQAKYARRDGKKWMKKTVEAYGEFALDDNDTAYILYGREMKIGIWNGIDWQDLTVNSPENGFFKSFAVDDRGYAHISYIPDPNRRDITPFLYAKSNFIIIEMAEPPPSNTKIRLQPSSQTINQQDEFTLQLHISEVENLAGYQLDLAFNPEFLEVQSANEGDFLKQKGETFFRESVIENGKIALAGALLAQGSVSGSGTLATLIFKAIREGETAIALQNPKVTRPNGSQIAVNLEEATVRVASPQVETPSPSTNLLVVSGTIRNQDGSPAEAGFSVIVAVGDNTLTTISTSGGDYDVTFFNPVGSVAENGDAVEVRVSGNGKSAVSRVVLTQQQINNNTATVDVSFSTQPEFNLTFPQGIGWIHIPLKVTEVNGKGMGIETISDLYDALGGGDNVRFIITYQPPKGNTPASWRSFLGNSSRGTGADRTITDNLGMITVTKNSVTLRLKGDALGTDGKSQIPLNPGPNLIGVPLMDKRLKRVSDLFSLEGIKGNAQAIIVQDPNDGKFKVVAQAGDDGDIPITGGQSFIITAVQGSTTEVSGVAWHNVSSRTAATPPMVLISHQIYGQTPILEVHGAVVDEITGLAKEGFHITVKNLSTGATLSTLSGSDTAPGGYSVTFVHPISGSAAQVGDLLEISTETPSQRVGVQPLRHIVSMTEVKNSQIDLPDLVAHEIPTDTKLLPNYPNPFNPETWIPFRLTEDASVTLAIYDTTGKVVRSIELGHKPAAVYESKDKAIYWDGRNDLGEHVASGIYFYVLTANDFAASRKMLVLK